MSLNPSEIKKDFPILEKNPEIAYLDNAATTQKPKTVINSLERFYKNKNSNIGRSMHKLAGKANKEYTNARKTASNFINCQKEELIFVRNTTEAMNLLANSLNIEGDVIIPEMAHHSNQLPWRNKLKHKNNKIKYIKTTDNYKLDLEHAKKIIDHQTSLISISHISNIFGTINPIKEISEIANDYNAKIVVDGAQSTPRIPVDVEDLKVDFYTFSGHKMLGPTGIGGLYGRKSHLKNMDPYQVGGGMIRKVTKQNIKYESIPEKFEAGTPHIAGATGLKAAIEYLENFEPGKIYEHESNLVENAVQKLNDIKGVKTFKPESEKSSILSFTMEEAHPHDISEIMDQNNIAIRGGHHCAQPQMEKLGITGTARASPYIYNNDEDIEKLINIVKEIKKVFK